MLWPLSLGVSVFDALLRRLADRPEGDDDEEEAFEDEIRSIVTEGLHDGLLEEDAREMIEGVIELGDTDVLDIMTPRANIDALDVSLAWPESLDFVIECGRTRIPRWRCASWRRRRSRGSSTTRGSCPCTTSAWTRTVACTSR